MATAKDGSEAFRAFVALVNRLRSKIAPASGELPVLYKGKGANGSATWQLIKEVQNSLKAKYGVDGKVVMLNDVISRLPSPVPGFKTLGEFANKAREMKLVDADEDDDMWAMMSACFAQNVGRNCFIWNGSTFAKDSILDEIELPLLILNRKLSEKQRKQAKGILKEIEQRKTDLKKIDKEFQDLFQAIKQRRKVIGSYKLVDQMTKYWS